MSKQQCLSCKKIGDEDFITADGLCFDCDVEKIEFVVPREAFDEMTDQLMMAQAKGRDKGQAN